MLCLHLAAFLRNVITLSNWGMDCFLTWIMSIQYKEVIKL